MLSVRDVSKSFEGREILKGISFAAQQGDSVAVVGPSGCGKTTLLNILVGYCKPDYGIIGCAEDMSYMCAGEVLIPSLTAFENILFPGNDPALAEALLIEAKLEVVRDKLVGKLSSGEYRRANLCRTLALDCPIVLLDEPTSNMDASTANIIREMIKRHTADRITVISTHDPELMKSCTYVIPL